MVSHQVERSRGGFRSLLYPRGEVLSAELRKEPGEDSVQYGGMGEAAEGHAGVEMDCGGEWAG
jgi:hypothetical protein